MSPNSSYHQEASRFPPHFHLLCHSFRFPTVLQRRWTAGDKPVERGLVSWMHLPPKLATWEDLLPLRQCFPRAPAWGHAGTQEEGDVSDQPTTVNGCH